MPEPITVSAGSVLSLTVSAGKWFIVDTHSAYRARIATCAIASAQELYRFDRQLITPLYSKLKKYATQDERHEELFYILKFFLQLLFGVQHSVNFYDGMRRAKTIPVGQPGLVHNVSRRLSHGKNFLKSRFVKFQNVDQYKQALSYYDVHVSKLISITKQRMQLLDNPNTDENWDKRTYTPKVTEAIEDAMISDELAQTVDWESYVYRKNCVEQLEKEILILKNVDDDLIEADVDLLGWYVSNENDEGGNAFFDQAMCVAAEAMNRILGAPARE